MNAEQVGAVLDELGMRFGATGAHLWEVLVRQAYVEFAVALACLLALAPLTAYCVRRYTTEDCHRDRETWGFAACVLAAALGFATIATVATVGGVLNPEYVALQRVLEALHP